MLNISDQKKPKNLKGGAKDKLLRYCEQMGPATITSHEKLEIIETYATTGATKWSGHFFDTKKDQLATITSKKDKAS